MDDAVPAGFVRLRVGGTVFEVSRDVLLSEPDSVFVAMLSGEWASRQGGSSSAAERPPMVFDRDPQRFRAVLNWLRTRELVLEGGVSAEGVKAEAEFFQLQALAEEASCMIHEREGHRLLQAAVDSRRGKLVSLGAGETASLPTGEPVLVHGPCVVAVHACFEAVGAGISGEMHVDGLGAEPEFVIHSSDSGRTLRAVGRVGPGRHHLQLLFRHCGMDEQPRSYVFGPARVEFWRYPSAHMVWMDEEAALKNTAAWYAHVHGPPSSPYPRSIPPGAGVNSAADYTAEPAPNTSFEAASAEELASVVGAISSCVYR